MNKNKTVQRILAVMMAGIIVFSLGMADISASAAKGKKKKAAEVDLNGTYHATMGIQTATILWITRMGYYEKSQNEFYGTENADKMLCENKETQEMEAQPGTFTDVEIKGNGTYTVSLENGEFSGEQIISQLHIATDIPVNDKIKFSDISLKINGKTITEFEEGFMENEEPYLQGGMVCLVFNHWRSELVKMLEEKGLPEDCSNGYTLLQGNGQENVSVTFTISGFEYDNPDAQNVSDGSELEAAGNSDASNNDISHNSQEKNDNKKATQNNSAGVAIVVVAIIAVIIIAVFAVKKKKS